jgi:hypothetical protein
MRSGFLRGTTLTLGCLSSVLLVMDSCDPTVQAAWETGITTSITGLMGALTTVISTLITTTLTNLITGSTGTGGTTTVQAIDAVFQWVGQVAC